MLDKSGKSVATDPQPSGVRRGSYITAPLEFLIVRNVFLYHSVIQEHTGRTVEKRFVLLPNSKKVNGLIPSGMSLSTGLFFQSTKLADCRLSNCNCSNYRVRPQAYTFKVGICDFCCHLVASTGITICCCT